MTEHPITPPPELVEQWRSEPEYSDGHHKITMVTMSQDRLMEICEKSALHGADRELEACIDWISVWHGLEHPELLIELLRAARRPEPPKSLKEQALEVLGNVQKGWGLAEVDLDTIRLALEQLND
jgi:hypothetical protein